MKRVVLDGLLVTNVEVVADDATGLIVPDECWVGPGLVWNGDTDEPIFSDPETPIDES
jgi:hypothetical protein